MIKRGFFLRIVCFFILIALIPSVSAVGFAGDGKIHVIYEPGLEISRSYNLIATITPPTNYTLKVEGAFADYVELSTTRFEKITPRDAASFSFNLKLPDELPEHLQTPGMQGTFINLCEEPKKSGEAGMFNVVTCAIVAVGVYVLHPDKYTESEFKIPYINEGEDIIAKLEITNFGQKTINSLKADIEISNKSGAVVRSFSTDTRSNLASKEEVTLQGSTPSLNLPNGNYDVKATLYWDGNTEVHHAPFKIGTRTIDIDSFTTRADINTISKLDIVVSSRWNSKLINVYGIIEINKDDQKLLLKTPPTDLSQFGSAKLSTYWDTTDGSWEEGNYSVKVSITMNNEPGVEETFILQLLKPEQKNSDSKSTKTKLSINNTTIIIGIVLVVVLILIIFNFFLLKRIRVLK